MYCSFYGIREKPFSITPDPKFLYLGKTHKEAFAHLLYGIRERGGFIVVTGEIGAGKTTLCRALLSHLDEDTLVAFIFNPTLSALELLKSINEDFGIASKGATKKELIDELNAFLLEKRKEGKNTVLIIDEAQNLDGEVLEQIRLLSNLETDTEKLLQIILIGQPEFRHILERPRLLQLNQRVTVRYHLRALTREETVEYIRHRLCVTDGEDKVFFSPEALRKIWKCTKGVPRLINVVCDRALLAGYGQRKKNIDGRMIEQVRKEVMGGAAWKRSLQFVRRMRRGLVPASLLAVFLLLLVFGFHAFLREGSNGVGEPTLADQSATSETAPVRLSAASVIPPLGTPADSSVPSGMPAGAHASEPGRSEEETSVARVSSSPDGAGSSPASSRQETEAPAPKAGSGESAGVYQTREGADPTDPEAAVFLHGIPSVGGVDGESDTIDVEGLFLQAFLNKTLLETREAAFLAVLHEWEQEFSEDHERRLYRAAPDLYKAAEAFGLECLRFRGNLNRVRTLNLPVLMELWLGESLAKRYVGLLSFEGAYGRIAPPLPDGSSLVPVGVLESSWHGTAFVLWRDAWGGRRFLARGMTGPSVSKMQSSLRELGYFKQTPSGVFDGNTSEAVRAFQRDHFLDEDGILGPQTRIVLARALRLIRMPTLEGES